MDIVLKNLTENIVLKKIDDLIDTLHCCKCEQCRLDIASYALNRLPAKYIATTQGELLSKLHALETQFDTTVTTVIVQGSMLVNMYPRHKIDPETIAAFQHQASEEDQ